MTLFYTIPMWSFLAITFMMATLLMLDGQTCFSNSTVAAGVLFISQSSVTLWVQFNKSKVGSSESAALFGDKHFTAMFSGNEQSRQLFSEVIRRHTPPISEKLEEV